MYMVQARLSGTVSSSEFESRIHSQFTPVHTEVTAGKRKTRDEEIMVTGFVRGVYLH